MTQEERDEILINLSKDMSSMKTKISSMEERISSMEERISSMEERISGMEERISGMEERISGMEENISSLNSRFDVLNQKVDALDKKFTIITDNLQKQIIELRQHMVVLENNLYEKISALFDAREVSLDNFERQDKSIKSIHNILEHHSYRISMLESKVN